MLYMEQEEKTMNFKANLVLLIMILVLPLAACSPKIYGMVELVDTDLKPVGDNPEGTVVNMINTTASLENASYAVAVNEEGNFESSENAISPGIYKVEASRIGYETATKTVEIGSSSSKKVDLRLKKIREGTRTSIEGATTDEDKIINPGEVNIQPPMM